MMSIFEDTLAYARGRSYVGWDLYDGESSRLLRALPVENRWLNLAFQQTVRRAPVNLRPLLLVERRRSFLGAALFARANFAAADLVDSSQRALVGGSERTPDADRYRAEARGLVDWLIENRSAGYSGFCGGHKHPLQGLRTRTEPNTPGVVGTSYAVGALLEASEHRGPDELPGSNPGARNPSASEPEPGGSRAPNYRSLARSAADFVVADLDYETCDAGARIKYKPSDPGDAVTLNANALGARMLLDLSDAFEVPTLRERGEAILDYVVSRQTDAGGWMYRDPPSASHLSMDNFHNGFVVESLHRHREVTGSDRYVDALDRALSFYRHTLFDDDGAPNHDESSPYPKDIHDVAQGVVVFSRVGDREFARRILRWGLDNLYAGDGRFYHEKRRHYTKRITLMRWCQAWMAHALAVYLRTGSQ